MLADTSPHPQWSLFQSRQAASMPRPPQSIELHLPQQQQQQTVAQLLVSLATHAYAARHHVHVPRVDLLEALSSPNASPQEKVDALKALALLVGQALGFLMVASMLWKLGNVIMNVVEVVLWPILVPFKVLRWFAGAS